MTPWQDYLKRIYFDPSHPASYAGPEKLYRVVKEEGKFKLGRYKIRRWLQDQESFSLTKHIRKRFPRSRVVVEGLDSQWEIDLMDMVGLHKENEDYKYVLVIIDVFSRYAWCIPLKNKTGSLVVEAMKSVFVLGRKPHTIYSDRGSEFANRTVGQYLKEQNVHQLFSHNETKANYCERLIKTLKNKLFRYMTKNHSSRYIDVLQKIVDSYNRTVHRSLGATPASVTLVNEGETRLNQYLLRTKSVKRRHPRNQRPRYKFKLGETVRVSHISKAFDREYSQKWTGELFTILRRYRREGIPVYQLRDWAGEDIKGTFYQSELQAIRVDENAKFHIKTVLKRRRRRGKNEALVRWFGWPKKYDSWILQSEIESYQ